MKSEAKPTSNKVPVVDPVASEGVQLHHVSGLTQEELKVLKAPFPKDRVGVKVQSFNRERTRALLVLYLQHTDVQNRIEEVDPSWSMEAIRDEAIDDTFVVRMRMTVKGISRENVGEGNDLKAAYSDALKRCAMLFGIGRYLYDSETVWVDYQEPRDRYKRWTSDDFERARDNPSPAPLRTMAERNAERAPEKEGTPRKHTRPREQLNRSLMSLYRPYLTRFPNTQFAELLGARYGVAETRLMTIEQLEDLVQFMEGQLRSAA